MGWGVGVGVLRLDGAYVIDNIGLRRRNLCYVKLREIFHTTNFAGLVSGWAVDVIDHDDFDGAFAGFEFQAELLLKSGEEGSSRDAG